MPFQILALSGGGYRGLFTVEILSRLEEQAGRPIGECFDLIAGTSIGGITAIGLAMGKRASEIREVFLERGERIFPKGERPANPLSKLVAMARMGAGAKYDGIELRQAIEDVVGKDALIGDARTRLVIPAVNMTKGSVQIFKTGHHPGLVLDPKRKAADVAMATSAAPLYFPLAKVGESYFVDGGLMANAPDMCAIHEATHFLKQEMADISILSIGTVTTGFSLPTSLGGNFGGWQWLTNGRLVSTVFSSQQQLVDYIVRHQLGRRYIRMDTRPSPEQSCDLGLDLATKERRGTLLGMAEGVYQEYAGTAEIRAMLAHQPAPATFFDASGKELR